MDQLLCLVSNHFHISVICSDLQSFSIDNFILSGSLKFLNTTTEVSPFIQFPITTIDRKTLLLIDVNNPAKSFLGISTLSTLRSLRLVCPFQKHSISPSSIRLPHQSRSVKMFDFATTPLPILSSSSNHISLLSPNHIFLLFP